MACVANPSEGRCACYKRGPMTSPLAPAARVLPLVLALGAMLSMGAAVRLLVLAATPTHGTGFWRIEQQGVDGCTPGEHWEARARPELVPEPFVPEGDYPPACVVWRSHMVVERPMRLEIELESDDDGWLWIDGREVISNPGAHNRTQAARTIDLTPGVHPVEARLWNRMGGAYFRLRHHDRRDPWMAGVAPLNRDIFFASRADAERALENGVFTRVRPERGLQLGLWIAASCVLAWMALRGHRRRDVALGSRWPLVDLGLALGISVIALAERSLWIPETDLAWDELWYWNAGVHQVRNFVLGDWSAEAFRYNSEHPPMAKWIFGLGGLVGGLDGARQLGAVMSAASVGMVYAATKILYGRRAAIGGALALAFMPHVVAHGRLVGLETITVVFWSGTSLALLSWLESIGWRAPRGTPFRDGDRVAAFVGGFLLMVGLLGRFTFVWIFPIVLGAIFLVRRRELGRGTLAFPSYALLGAIVGTALGVYLWPWIHTDPSGHLGQTFAHWQGRVPTEYFLGERTVGPPFSYYPVCFVVTSPTLSVIAALVAIPFAWRRDRRAALFVLAWLLVPFLHGVSSFRQDLARYVVQSWPALAMLGGVLVAELGRWIERALARRRMRAQQASALALAPALAMGVYVASELASLEPFPLDYFGEMVGGPGGVAERELFDVSWWAEGAGHAVQWLNEHGREGARVRIDTSNWDVRARLRDDFVEVQFRSHVPADYVITNYHLYGDPPPPGCERIHHVEVRGAPLASVWECPRSGAR